MEINVYPFFFQRYILSRIRDTTSAQLPTTVISRYTRRDGTYVGEIRTTLANWNRRVIPGLADVESAWLQLARPEPSPRGLNEDYYPLRCFPRINFDLGVHSWFGDFEGRRDPDGKWETVVIVIFTPANPTPNPHLTEQYHAPNVVGVTSVDGNSQFFCNGYYRKTPREEDRRYGCFSCGNEGGNLHCVRCGFARYCGAACQKEDWKRHRKHCNI